MADGRWQDGDGRMAEAEGGGRTERWRLRSPGSVFPARVPCRCWLCLEGSQDGMKPERAAGFCAKANAAVLRAALLCSAAMRGLDDLGRSWWLSTSALRALGTWNWQWMSAQAAGGRCAMDGDGKRVTGRRRCCDRSARAVSACLDGAKGAVVVVAGWCLGRRMAEWDLKIGQKWISNCWCRCLLPACHSKHCTALLAKSSRLLSPCESVHLCELPAPCPVSLCLFPPGARAMHGYVPSGSWSMHSFRDGRRR